MILTEQKGTVLKSNDVVSTGFRIKASRKAFEILSAGLYSDKVRAIIRELSTNAADAHTSAGKKDVPFKVHLPNNLEPWFAVEDYGTGLSEDRIMNLYTTYFDSDKTDSNEYTGALGLGSKSPFSYTDSFTVESRFGGEKKVYNAYLSEDRMPSIAKMTEEPTDEPNGLTIRFPVKNTDFSAFRDKAQQTLRWFRVRPVVAGASIEFPNTEYLVRKDWYAVTKRREGRSYVVMGNIAYPIDAYDFLTGYDGEVTKLRALVEWGIEINVSIGDVDIAASREKLSYDKQTVALLKEKLGLALKDLEQEVTKDISAQPTLWKARRKLHEVRNSFKGFNFTAEYAGEKINDFVKIGTKEVVVSDPGVVPEVTKNVPVAVAERLKIKSRNADRLVVKKDRADIIYADGTVVFLADDRGAYSAVRRYLDDKPWDTQVLLLTDYDQKWLEESGVIEACIKTSTLPKPVRQSYSNGRGGAATKAKVYEFVPSGNSGNGNTNASGYWKPAEVDVDEQDGVYVEILYFNARHKDGEATFHPGDLKRPLDLLKALGRATTIYGIRPADKALVDEADGDWKTLKDFVKEVLDDAADTYSADYLKVKEKGTLDGGYYSRNLNAKLWKDGKFKPESPFGVLIRELLDADRAEARKGVKEYGELRRWLGLETGDEDHTRLSKMQEAVFDRYPLLKHLDRYGEHYGSAVEEYVNLIDASR